MTRLVTKLSWYYYYYYYYYYCVLQFYNDLTEMLIKCQTKIAEFCSARDAEKEELLEDLSVNVVPHHSSCPPPQMSACQHSHQLQIPSYQQQQPGVFPLLSHNIMIIV